MLLKPLVRMYYVLGKLDSGLWVPEVNPVHCLDGVRVPILFCHGEQDELAPFSDALALYDRYQGPKSCYWVAGGSHYDLPSGTGTSIWPGSGTSSRAASSRKQAVAWQIKEQGRYREQVGAASRAAQRDLHLYDGYSDGSAYMADGSSPRCPARLAGPTGWTNFKA